MDKDHWRRQIHRRIKKAHIQALVDYGLEEDEAKTYVEHGDLDGDYPEKFREEVEQTGYKAKKDEARRILADLADLYIELEDLYRERREWPPKWITEKYKGIVANLSKKKNRPFVPLYGKLRQTIIPAPECRELMEEKGIGPYKTENSEDRSYVFLKPLDAERKKALAESVGISLSTLNNHIKAMVHWGLLHQDWGRHGERQPEITAIGYWHVWEGNKFKPVYFLKEDNQQMRGALTDYDPFF